MAILDVSKDLVFDCLFEELPSTILLDPDVWNTRIYQILRRLLDAIGVSVRRGGDTLLVRQSAKHFILDTRKRLTKRFVLFRSTGTEVTPGT